MRTVRRQGCRQIHSLNHKQKNDWQAQGTAALGNGKFRVWVWKEGREAAKQPVATDGNRNSSKTNWNEGAAEISKLWLGYYLCVCAQRKRALSLLSPNCPSSLSIPQINNPQLPGHTRVFTQNKIWESWALGTALSTGQGRLRKKINSHPALGKGGFGESNTILTPVSFINNLGLNW